MDGITDSLDVSLSKLWDIVKDKEAWRGAVHGVAKNKTQRSDCITVVLKCLFAIGLSKSESNYVPFAYSLCVLMSFKFIFIYNDSLFWTSLVAQWIRIHLPMQGT